MAPFSPSGSAEPEDDEAGPTGACSRGGRSQPRECAPRMWDRIRSHNQFRPLRHLASTHSFLALAALLSIACASGCCRLPNKDYPVPDPTDPTTTFILYGDSFVNRLGTLTGYGAELEARLEARGEAVADEGNAGREAGIGAIDDPVNDRCPALVCQVFYNCLAKGNAPLVTVLAEHPNARKLLITLGGVETLEGLKLAYGEPWPVPDPDAIPHLLVSTAERVAASMSRTLEIALADRTWDWIGLTSYPYMPTDSVDPVVPCPTSTPVGPADQKVLNDLSRTLDRILATVAERHDIHFVSLLDAIGGGEPVPGGENGPPGRYFDDCGHPTPEGYTFVVERILAALG